MTIPELNKDEIIQNEVWKDVKGFEGVYKVSSHGRIYSLPRKDARGHSIKGKLLKPGVPGNHGYYVVNLMCDKNKRLAVPVHRIVAENFIDNPNNVKTVNHIDGNKLNNSVKNLEWMTHEENLRHALKNGLMQNHFYATCGNSHPRHKITDVQVQEIRRLYEDGNYKSPALAKMFNISKAHVCKIIKNEIRNQGSEVRLCKFV